MAFTPAQKIRLGRSLVTRNCPVYVQYYITSRCNMRCEQCNIIYAHADVPEANLDLVFGRKLSDRVRLFGFRVEQDKDGTKTLLPAE